MEGMLLVPPDKGTIIGRAVWKVSEQLPRLLWLRRELTMAQSRYVVIGSPQREDLRSSATLSQALTTSRIQASRASANKGPPKAAETVCFSVYKTKVSHWRTVFSRRGCDQ
jgi:hypothetical protein